MQKYRGLIVLLAFFAIWFVPVPEGVDAKAWFLLAIFAATIVGLILRPIPMGAVVLVGLTASALTGTVTLRVALSGFANPTVWLIVIAFLFARAFILTGLGRRIAFLCIRAFGKNTLGLAYSVILADLVMAPATPSNTARAGGIIYPILRSLASGFGSEPGPTARRIGAFLIQSEYHADLVTAAMFMTSMAANPLAAELAYKSSGVQLSWGMWALAGLVPGLISLILIPLVLYKVYPPEIKKTPQAASMAQQELGEMGPTSRRERVLVVVFLGILGFWSTSQLHQISATAVALAGVSVLLLFDVLSWKNILEETGAWDALIWFGGLVMMAGQLNELGLIGWFTTEVSTLVSGWPWIAALIVLLLIYFYSHYGFASMTAHVTAMYPAFLVAAIAAGAPAYLAALALAFFSNLNASTTHYGAGPAPIYFGSGYVELADWWKLGLLISVVNLIVWIGIGFPYWKLLGLW